MTRRLVEWCKCEHNRDLHNNVKGKCRIRGCGCVRFRLGRDAEIPFAELVE